MSEDRLSELGIPRRSFLTKTAAAAFAAPVIVSFGLDGVAEASPTSTHKNQPPPVQCFANQPGQSIANMFAFGEAQSSLFAALTLIVDTLNQDTLFDTPIRMWTTAWGPTSPIRWCWRCSRGGGKPDVCHTLAALQNQVQQASSELPSGFATQLIECAQVAAAGLACVCT